jgi:hypothetical protein
MKKLFRFGAIICILLLFFVSCDLFNKKETFDKDLLPGKWQQGTVFERYNSDGTGKTWDTADDVTEDEAQPFTWTLTDDNLTQVHLMEMGGKIPKSFTITKLSSTTLTYHDDYKVSYTFTKVD